MDPLAHQHATADSHLDACSFTDAAGYAAHPHQYAHVDAYADAHSGNYGNAHADLDPDRGADTGTAAPCNCAPADGIFGSAYCGLISNSHGASRHGER